MRYALPTMLLLSLCFSACVHTPSSTPTRPLPPGSPTADAILADLVQADRKLINFSSRGALRMQRPGEAGIQRFDTSHVRFLRPARFYADARKLGQAVKVYINGDTFLLELPSENVFYYGSEGDRFDDVALEIAPSLLFRELFLVDTLAGLDVNQIEVQSWDAEAQRAVLAVYRAGRRRMLERHLTVERGTAGWQVAESRLYDAAGAVLCETRCENYDRLDGVYMPKDIRVDFPQSGAALRYEIVPNLLKANRENPLDVENVAEVRKSLLEKGYREITGVAGE